MAGRRTNLALAALLPAAFVTGVLAFGIGTGWNRWATIAHGVAGLAIVILTPWKSVIARRGLRRARPGRTASLLFSIAVAVAVAAGVLHSTGVARWTSPLSAMQVHVGASLVAFVLAIRHLRARPVRPHRTDLSRRQALRTGAVVGGAGLAYLAVEGTVRLAKLPGARRRFTGSFEKGSFEPGEMPVTQWLDDSVPAIDTGAWRLEVRAGDRRWFSYDDLAGFDDRFEATIDCTGGWYARQVWEGVRLDRLLEIDGSSRSILVRSATGYARRFPAGDAPRLLLALRVRGEPLSAGHGSPARLVVPGRRGFWWVKWVEHIEADDVAWWRQSPFPLT